MDLFREVKKTHPELGDSFLFLTGGAKDKEAERFLDQEAARVIFKPNPARRHQGVGASAPL